MITNFLNMGISKRDIRLLKVENVYKKQIATNDSDSYEKIVIVCIDKRRKVEFDISDVWLEGSDGVGKVVPLIFETDSKESIIQTSNVAMLLKHYGCETIGDLIGKKIQAVPDKNEYLVAAIIN